MGAILSSLDKLLVCQLGLSDGALGIIIKVRLKVYNETGVFKYIHAFNVKSTPLVLKLS